MENSEIFVLLGKILAKIEHLERQISNIESKLVTGVDKRIDKKINPAAGIKKEIEEMKQMHMKKPGPARVDLTGVPGAPDLAHLAGIMSSLKGKFTTPNQVEEIQEVKEVKDEESNK